MFSVPRHRWMSLLVVIVTISLLLLTDVVHGADPALSKADPSTCPSRPIPAERRLLKCLLKDYNPDVRPVYDPQKAVNVTLDVTYIQIIDVDSEESRLDIRGWTHKTWTDEQLTWKPEDFGGIKVLRIPAEKIWTPDMVLYNADKEARVAGKLTEVHSNGKVIWLPYARLIAHCQLDFKWFPFDSQTCMFSFGSWTYDITKVNFLARDNRETRQVYGQNEFQVMSHSIEVHNRDSGNHKLEETYPVVSLHITVKRRGAFYRNMLVAPAVLLALMTTFVFIIPPASHQRMPFSVGLLLCQMILLFTLKSYIPTAINVFPLIGIHVLMQLVLLTISIILSILIFNLFHYEGRRNTVPPIIRRLLLGRLSQVLCLKPDAYSDLYNSEPRTVDELGTSLHPATVDSTLEDIRGYLKTLAAKSSNPVAPSMWELVDQEWKQVALVLDRMLFIVYLLLTVIGTMAFFCR